MYTLNDEAEKQCCTTAPTVVLAVSAGMYDATRLSFPRPVRSAGA
jgi:hypothetical protein